MFTAIRNWLRGLFGKGRAKPQETVQRNKSGKRLSLEDRRQIEALIAKAKGTDKKEMSAQDSIPYQKMYPDGICRVSGNYYTKTVQFQDINYQLSQNEDKTAIFEGWSDFLNYFDSSIHVQLSFLNLSTSWDGYSIVIASKPDGFDDVRGEYSGMLQNQLARGNNGLTKRKYLTFGIEAEDFRTAKFRLERIEMDILNHFKQLGVLAAPLDGAGRLRLFHSVFHMENKMALQRTEQEKAKRKLEKQERRFNELDAIIQRLYEDHVIGKLSEERFAKLSEGYEQEQAALKQSIEDLSAIVHAAQTQAVNVQSF